MDLNELELLTDVGFTKDQAEALGELFATRGHGHNIEDVAGLEEVLDEIGEEGDSDETAD